MLQWLRIFELLLSLHLPSPEQFHDEQEKILWALTFFKGGHTAKWSENVRGHLVWCLVSIEGLFY